MDLFHSPLLTLPYSLFPALLTFKQFIVKFCKLSIQLLISCILLIVSTVIFGGSVDFLPTTWMLLILRRVQSFSWAIASLPFLLNVRFSVMREIFFHLQVVSVVFSSNRKFRKVLISFRIINLPNCTMNVIVIIKFTRYSSCTKFRCVIVCTWEPHVQRTAKLLQFNISYNVFTCEHYFVY